MKNICFLNTAALTTLHSQATSWWSSPRQTSHGPLGRSSYAALPPDVFFTATNAWFTRYIYFTHTHRRVRIYIYSYIYTCIPTCRHAHTHTYVCIYIYMYMCVCARVPVFICCNYIWICIYVLDMLYMDIHEWHIHHETPHRNPKTNVEALEISSEKPSPW